MVGSWFLVALIVVVIVEVNVIVTVEVLVVEIILVDVITLPILYSVDVPSAVAVNLFIDALADIMIAGLTWNGVEVLADVVTALEFPVPTPLEEFSR